MPQYDLELKRAVLEEVLGYVPYNGDYVVYSQKLNMQDISQDSSPSQYFFTSVRTLCL